MSLNFYFEKIEPFTIEKSIEDWIEKTILIEEKKAGDISFIFCSNDYLLSINKEYLNHHYYTDVITFDYVEDDLISGDIFISTEMVEENAQEFNVSFQNELNRVMIHGVLHLIGYKDKTESEQKLMTKKEDQYLSQL